MKLWIFIAVSLLASHFAMAAGASCGAGGTGPNVPEEVKRRLAAACAQADSWRYCEKQANDKKLLGEARSSFMQKCFRDASAGASRRQR